MSALTPGVRALILPGGSRGYVGTVCMVTSYPKMGFIGSCDADSKEALICNVTHHDGENADGLACELARVLVPLKGDPDAARKRSYRRTVKA